MDNQGLETFQDSQLNVYNFQAVMQNPPANYEALRFDPNNKCNLHCVYCHNAQTDDAIDAERFVEFLHTKVGTVQDFQFGCIMEPTLDRRMTDFMLRIAESPAKPVRSYYFQTNGILLHRHDHGKMREAGLTRLSVSIDSADTSIQKELRNGTSLQKVVRNIKEFAVACPETDIHFVTTVTRVNIDKVEDLIALGLDMGVGGFTFREVFYYPGNKNNMVDHARMPKLLLHEGQFDRMIEHVLRRFEGAAEFGFFDNKWLHESSKRMVRDSRYVGQDIDDPYAAARPGPLPAVARMMWEWFKRR